MRPLARQIWLVGVVFVAGLVASFVAGKTSNRNIESKQHVLGAPLIVFSGGAQANLGVLPAGTSLRYIESLPEGIDRYHVVLNVEKSPLPLEEVQPPDRVDPLTAMPQHDPAASRLEDVPKLLRALGVTKAELQQIERAY